MKNTTIEGTEGALGQLIYSVYGQKLSVTAIIKRLIADKKFGGHPGLRSLVH